MSAIKVGQIYTYKNEPYIITKLTPDTPYKEGTACCLYKDGYVEELWDVNAAANPLIAEYPTWKEAVNSPEFRGE